MRAETKLGNHRIGDIERALRSTSASFADHIECFGLDQKVLALAERNGARFTVAKSYYRPIQEAALISSWDNLAALDFDSEWACNLVSLLTGSRRTIRKNPMIGKAPDGTRFAFAKYPDPGWIDTLRYATESAKSPIELAADLYRTVIVQHPFTDGNGRFSRAMIYAALARFDLIQSPCLGLNGVYEIHRDAMGRALRASHQYNSPLPLMDAIADMLIECTGLVRQLMEKR